MGTPELRATNQLTPHFVLEPVELHLDGIRPVHQREEVVGVQAQLRRPTPARGAPVRRRIPLLAAAAVGHLRSEPRRHCPPYKSRGSASSEFAAPVGRRRLRNAGSRETLSRVRCRPPRVVASGVGRSALLCLRFA